MRIVVERLTSVAELERLRGEWDALHARVPEATPFQSAAWLLPWWRAFGQGDPLVLALRQANRLVGVVPLYVFGGHATNELRFIGCGNTDQLDALFAPEVADECARLALREVEAICESRRCIGFLDRLAASSPLRVPAVNSASGRLRVHECEPHLVLELPASGEEAGLMERAAPGLARQLAYARRRTAREGVHHTLAVGDDVDSAMRDLFRLHSARWAARGQPGVFDTVQVRRFHLEAARALTAGGWLHLHVLRAGRRVIGVLYALHGGDRACYYASGFDPAFRALSPGQLLIGRAIEHAANCGVRIFDFLRGREAYKFDWGGREFAMFQLWIGTRLEPHVPREKRPVQRGSDDHSGDDSTHVPAVQAP